MDADNVILLALCLGNRARPVCRFAIDYLGQTEVKGHGVQNVLIL